ncbi:hypothetical protein [Novosphingobium sp.]|uniref:ArnT family glycosyltransferase n=1 Tax=Novosphingobium sp. TaxID=1874826 RepID=UPI002B46C543|nr:hypothetical protein [Novosphingobium sp.]HKR90866.1 hypothetical protein [Novosphingobium sp.]
MTPPACKRLENGWSAISVWTSRKFAVTTPRPGGTRPKPAKPTTSARSAISFLSFGARDMTYPLHADLPQARTKLTFGPLASFLLLLSIAIATRAPLYGDPLIHVDETFYNLVGERMLSGALPFVDIWDRKPIGLFLIYALSHLIGGHGVLAYQLIATVSVALTGWVIAMTARRIADPLGAFFAGCVYIFALALFRCSGGQSPVFYNLPMVVAASMILALLTEPAPRRLMRRGSLAMLLVGLALQIKYSVVFEGVGFGLALVWLMLRRAGWLLTLPAALAWIACALLPTALALGWYWHLGYQQQFIWANFLSIFARNTGAALSFDRITDLLTDFGRMLPFWGTLIVLHRRRRRDGAERDPALRWLAAWSVVATGGFLVFGTYYDHYTAALLPPFSILIAPMLGTDPARRLVTQLVCAFVVIGGGAILIANRIHFGGPSDLEAVAAQIRPQLKGRCLYIFEGNAALYSATDACLISRFGLPQHISGATDSVAIDVDARDELRTILARRPGVIVTGEKPVSPRPNWSVRPIMAAALARDYELYAHVHLGSLKLRLYRLRD